MNINEKYPNRSQAHVLVVDDDETARRSLAEILHLEGYQVEQTANAAQAIKLLEQRPFDVILLDLRMPIEDTADMQGITEQQAGLVVLYFVTKKSPGTPVIFLTAHASLETAIEALRYHADDYLLKPASPEQIIAAVDKALWRHLNEIQKQSQTTAIKIAKSIATELSQSIDRLEMSLQTSQDIVPDVNQVVSIQSDNTLTDTPDVLSYEGKASETLWKQTVVVLENGILIDLKRREIRQRIESHGGKDFSMRRLSLTPSESKLMEVFAQNPSKVLTHQELVAQVQGFDTTAQEAPSVLRPLISRLRHKLKSFPNGDRWIQSIRGMGYVFDISPDLPTNPRTQAY